MSAVRVRDSILGAVGATPMVWLDRLTAGLPARILLKLEMLNPGGSHKTRIAVSMIRAAERDGLLRPNRGQTILEPTGGNTGLGIAIAAAVLGYRVVLVIPDNYSPAKQRLLQAYGVEVRLSDSSRGNNSHGELAMEIQFEHPEYVMLNQAANPANPEIHRLTTAREIIDDLDGEPVDCFVAGIGTGGHITAIGQVLRKHQGALHVVAVQPEGCDMFAGTYRPHRLQGLSIGMIPPVLDPDVLDETVTVTEREAIEAMSLLIRTEGIAAGPSTGANIAACRRLAAAADGPRTFLTVAYDQVHDYLDLL
jgi:cysteine synthase A